MPMILKFVLFGAAGLMMEVFWTGMGSLINKDRRATSKTSIWMFFIYGATAFMTPLIHVIQPFPWFIRGLVYAAAIFLIEYTAGITMKAAKMCPWDYSHTRYNVHGVIRLDYAPVWVAVGLIKEFLYFNYFM